MYFYDYHNGICMIIKIVFVFGAIDMSIQVQIAWLLSCQQKVSLKALWHVDKSTVFNICMSIEIIFVSIAIIFVQISQLYFNIIELEFLTIIMLAKGFRAIYCGMSANQKNYYAYDYCNCICTMIKLVFV